MIKPILQLYPMIPAKDEAERAALRPIGRNRERYHEVVHGLSELVKAADELGFWGVSTIEHHFHSEGYEVGPSPSVLGAHWAAIAKNLRIGSLGYTMSAQHPLRVAEDTAIIDHLTNGRCFVGFSRGYQRRWTNVFGQHYGTRATMSPAGRTEEQQAELDDAVREQQKLDDEINRRLFEEHIDIVLRAWTEESIEQRSDHWQIPFPFDEGMDWEMAEVTARLGAPGEIGPDGKIRRVSVAPAPYSDPHPPVFVAANASLETVEYAGSRNFIPAYFAPTERAAKFAGSYVDAARAAGHDYAVGQNQCLVRWIQIADSREAALKAIDDYDVEIYRNLYYPLAPNKAVDESNPSQSLIDTGLWLAGTPDEVRDQFVQQWSELPAEYVVFISHYGQQPLESAIRNLELFVEHVKPTLDELTDYESGRAVQAPAASGDAAGVVYGA